MRAFVTGGTGFVGSHLVDALLARGGEVTCLARDPAKLERLFPDNRPRVVVGDLTSEVALRSALEAAEVIFHLAGATAARNRREFFQINLGGTERLLAATAQAGPPLRRFVHVSSLAAAGPSGRGRPLDEDGAPHPVSAYGESKLAAEAAVRRSRLPWTIVRPSAVYGPRDVAFARLFRLAARWRLLPLVSRADQELSLIHVGDLVAALLAATAPAAEGRTYFATHPTVVTARGVLEEIGRAVGRALGRPGSPAIIVPLPPWLARTALTTTGVAAHLAGRTTLLSVDKARELLAEAWTCSPAALGRDTGWRPVRPLTDGLAETARWYRHQGWL